MLNYILWCLGVFNTTCAIICFVVTLSPNDLIEGNRPKQNKRSQVILSFAILLFPKILGQHLCMRDCDNAFIDTIIKLVSIALAQTTIEGS